jgi:hypothetical protein
MIFMSQSGITDASRAAAWDAWYVEHLKIMLTVPGVSSAQRFMTDIVGYSPSLAMYTMTGPEVFHDPYYLSVRGMGEWLSLIDQRYYRRNLFAGLDRAPAVAADQRLTVADRDRQDPALADLHMTWLNSVTADRSTPMRGIAVVDAAVASELRGREVAVYRPVTDPRVSVPKAHT